MAEGVYKTSWEQDERFKDWIRPDRSSNLNFYCRACEKSLIIGNKLGGFQIDEGQDHLAWLESLALLSEVDLFSLCSMMTIQ